MVPRSSLDRGLPATRIQEVQNLHPTSLSILWASIERSEQGYLADFTSAAQAVHAIDRPDYNMPDNAYFNQMFAQFYFGMCLPSGHLFVLAQAEMLNRSSNCDPWRAVEQMVFIWAY